MPKKSTPHEKAKQRPLTVKLPAELDRLVREHATRIDSDLSKLTRNALREKLQRDGVLV